MPVSLRRALTLAAAAAAALCSPAASAATGSVPAASAAAVATRAASAVAPGFNVNWKQAPANAVLNGVSCGIRGPFCMAVGSYTDELGGQHSAAQSWDGVRWHVLGGVPGARLSGVSCAGPSFCVAVGGVIDQWNGRSWRQVKRLGGPVLLGVSCPRPSFCMAVGNDGRDEGNVAMEWNGTTWRALATPGNGCVPFCGLSHVACVSAFRCMAVGGTGNNADTEDFAEAMRWNGHRWLETGLPEGQVSTALSGISCNRLAGGTWNCVAVGNFTTDSPPCNCILADGWNGSTWQQLSTPPVTGGLTGVSCPAKKQCEAVGGSLAFSWNGSAWQQQTIALPGETATSLSDISCWVPEHCMAVGSYTESSGARLTLAEELSIGSWTVSRTFSQGDPFAGLSGVSCPFSFACVAVGTSITPSGGYGALALRWDGHRWSALLPGSPGSKVSVLTSVSCPNAHTCMAVGYYDVAGAPQTLAELWNGTSWQVLATGHIGTLNSVSCPPLGGCTAVGSYFGAQGHRLALALSWNGTTWQVQATPEPGATISQLSGIWCNRAANCTAVGAYNTSLTSTLKPLTLRWTAGTWQMQANPGGSRQLAAISCPGPTHCVSVGSDLVVRGPHLPSGPVSMLRDGTTWSLRQPASPSGVLRVRLAGVSCVTRFACQADGGALLASGDAAPLAEGWNGRRWLLEPVTVPKSAFNQLYAVSCARGSVRCMAVGATGAQQTLALEWNGTRWLLLKTPNP